MKKGYTTTVTTNSIVEIESFPIIELIDNPKYFQTYLTSLPARQSVGVPRSSRNDPLARFLITSGYPEVSVADTALVLGNHLIEMSSWSIRFIELVDAVTASSLSAKRALSLLEQALRETAENAETTV